MWARTEEGRKLKDAEWNWNHFVNDTCLLKNVFLGGGLDMPHFKSHPLEQDTHTLYHCVIHIHTQHACTGYTASHNFIPKPSKNCILASVCIKIAWSGMTSKTHLNHTPISTNNHTSSTPFSTVLISWKSVSIRSYMTRPSKMKTHKNYLNNNNICWIADICERKRAYTLMRFSKMSNAFIYCVMYTYFYVMHSNRKPTLVCTVYSSTKPRLPSQSKLGPECLGLWRDQWGRQLAPLHCCISLPLASEDALRVHPGEPSECAGTHSCSRDPVSSQSWAKVTNHVRITPCTSCSLPLFWYIGSQH